jgi:hypothetical protein
LDTLTAHFSVGSVNARVTLPTAFHRDSATIFMEVAGANATDLGQDLFMESGVEGVQILDGADGAALHLNAPAWRAYDVLGGDAGSSSVVHVATVDQGLADESIAAGGGDSRFKIHEVPQCRRSDSPVYRGKARSRAK